MTPCKVWTGATAGSGYGVRGTNKGGNYYVHRRAWEDAHGPIPAGMFVLHRCDNPPCYNVDHLFLGTPRENMMDKLAKGRQRTPAKLSNEQVAEIRARYAAGGVNQYELAAEYGVSQPHVSDIVRGAKRNTSYSIQHTAWK